MPKPLSASPRARALLSELFIFAAFAALTCAMTWPWVLNLRDAAADNADSYMFAWILWWDYHATFNDPLNLFHANIFYPYRYTLAFCEHIYGVALPLFPLFALGLRPLTVAGIATLLGFTLCGYGAFRLTRTLTGSVGAAWVAGVAFAFVPLRFNLLAHLDYLNAGWIPLLLEALVLFARRTTWRRAAWLGAAFLMNALSCVTWFILTLLPLGLSLWVVAAREGSWRDRRLWLRGAVCVGVASLSLLPFLLPYYWASELYGFRRGAADVAAYSSNLTDWLVADERNKLWHGFGSQLKHAVLPLFPGLLLPLLALAAFLLVPRRRDASRHADDDRETAHEDAPSTSNAITVEGATTNRDVLPRDDATTSERRPTRKRRRVLFLLDAFSVLCLAVAVLATIYDTFYFHIFGVELLRASDATDALFLLTLFVIIRFALAYPRVLRSVGVRGGNLFETLRHGARGEAFQLGVIWLVLGFAGSLGVNFFFHRFLFERVPLFQAVRSPARWAMLACLGLAVLGGLGAKRLAEVFARRSDGRTRAAAVLAYALVAAALLFEFRVAPLFLIRGAVDPDEVTLHLKRTEMRGGIVELPAGEFVSNYQYLLRAADHGRPLVTAVSGFITPVEQEIEALSRARPVPERFLELLERIPASYVVVHNSTLNPESRLALEAFLARSRASNRLRFIRSFGDRDDLYAVTKTEPNARALAPAPPPTTARDLVPFYAKAEKCLPPEYSRDGFLIYRLHKSSFARLPRRAGFLAAVEAARRTAEASESDEQGGRGDFVRAWAESEEFKARYERMSDEEFVDSLFKNAGLSVEPRERESLADGLAGGTLTRVEVLRRVASDDTLYLREFSRAFILMHYFYYLRRNPDDPPDTGPGGLEYWAAYLDRTGDFCSMGGMFRASREFQTLPGN
ncbi:MAG TPA: hypothetical protein VFS10_20870 [Pyrinomonadaceae bacterium]|nr:hypothetical protein [Pyrinomonadaceae bacterium]